MTIYILDFHRPHTGSKISVTLPKELNEALSDAANSNTDCEYEFQLIHDWGRGEFPGWEVGHLTVMSGEVFDF